MGKRGDDERDISRDEEVVESGVLAWMLGQVFEAVVDRLIEERVMGG